MSLNLDVYPLFSTPLSKTNLCRDDSDILSFTKNEKFIFLREEKNGLKSSSCYVLESSDLVDLKKNIQENVNFFAYEVLNIEKSIQFFITNSWIMKHETGHWTQEHYHEHCLISGIYYFDVEENSGDITFVQNNMNLSIFPPFFYIPYANKNIFNLKRFTITPKNGDLILFPSHLIHSVDANLNKKDRHCLAFNTFIKGTLGSDASFNRLDFK
jgi:uncharacterized protein (TIGR02466 family)